MNDDKELLTLAAKAAGVRWSPVYKNWVVDVNGVESRPWRPLTDDGDAMRLAVKLRLDIARPHAEHKGVCVWVDHLSDFIVEPEGSDPYAATRRAIVRAAAEIWKTAP